MLTCSPSPRGTRPRLSRGLRHTERAGAAHRGGGGGAPARSTSLRPGARARLQGSGPRRGRRLSVRRLRHLQGAKLRRFFWRGARSPNWRRSCCAGSILISPACSPQSIAICSVFRHRLGRDRRSAVTLTCLASISRRLATRSLQDLRASLGGYDGASGAARAPCRRRSAPCIRFSQAQYPRPRACCRYSSPRRATGVGYGRNGRRRRFPFLRPSRGRACAAHSAAPEAVGIAREAHPAPPLGRYLPASSP